MLPALAHAQSIHDTGTVEFEVFANGALGTEPIGGNQFPGGGFVLNGDNGLFHATLAVGVSDMQVSGNYYGGTDQAPEFSPVSGPTVIDPVFEAPFEEFDQAFEAVFDDSAAPNPIGLTVTQRSYSRSDFPNQDFVVVEYTIENTSGADIEDAYVGIFADWDVGTFEQNLGGYDEDTQLLYIFDDSETSTNYFGVTALGDVDVSGINYDALGGAETDLEIFQFLTTVAPVPPLVDDRRATLGTGPYDITDGESIVVRFAFVGGPDEAGVIASAAAAQELGTTAPPLEQAIHDTGDVMLEVYANGSIGAFADEAGASVGTGFTFEGSNGLYEGEFLVGASNTQVSGDAYEFPDIEWTTVDSLRQASPPDGANQAFTASYSDAAAANPIGVTVDQLSFSGEDDDFVTLEFTVTNTSGADLSDIYLGIFVDWDVSNFEQNIGGYDEDNRVLYVFSDEANPADPNYYGQVAIGSEDDVPVSGVFYDALPGDDILFQALTNISPDPIGPADRRTVLGLGPYSIADGESATAVFAIVGGENEQDVIANACKAQGNSDCNPVSTEESTPDGTFTLHAAYPNPFRSATNVGFTLPASQDVRLTVYDVLGRRVTTLADGLYPSGYNSVRFDASNLPSGMYVVRLETGSLDLTERVSLVR